MNWRRFFAAATLTLACLQTASAGTLAQFRTVLGDLEVELYDADKPVTTTNFKRLVMAGAYTNTFFHRVVPGFVAQAGGFATSSRTDTNLFAPLWPSLNFVPNFGAITNEFTAGRFLSNTNGTLAMAKTAGNPNSATSQWFFNLADNSANLDNQNGGFTVFGRVVRDTGPPGFGGLIGFFNYIAYLNGVMNMSWWYPSDPVATNFFTTLPVIYSGLAHPRYSDLLYVDVTLLSVRSELADGTNRVSWNSIAGRTNVVEFTETFPPAWKNLVTTNGDGSRFTVPDAIGTNRSRFYRVTVAY